MSDRGVIFDMDGVLIDSYDAHFESWKRIADNHGLEMTEEMFASTFGQTNPTIIRQLWPDRADRQTIAEMGEEKERIFRDILREDLPEMPGAGDLLRRLDESGFRLAVGSSGPTENVQAVLENLPGAERISAIVTGSDVSHGKPDPEVFLIAAGKLGLPPASCLVVEDAPPGVEAARNAGMACIALTGTAPADMLTRRGAALVVDGLDEISAYGAGKLIEVNTNPSETNS
ncbi:MAG: HAD family hydrolase [Phycisphaerae bacterium]